MNIDHLGALVCRGVGLLLLVLGSSTLLGALFFGVRSGWTYYAPIGRDQISSLQVLLISLRTSFPAIVQFFAGAALLVFGRPLGRLLASGLSGSVS